MPSHRGTSSSERADVGLVVTVHLTHGVWDQAEKIATALGMRVDHLGDDPGDRGAVIAYVLGWVRGRD